MIPSLAMNQGLIVDGIVTDNLSLASEDNDTTGVVISSIVTIPKRRKGRLRFAQSRPFGSLRVFLAADNASEEGSISIWFFEF